MSRNRRPDLAEPDASLDRLIIGPAPAGKWWTNTKNFTEQAGKANCYLLAKDGTDISTH